jgi:cytidylate kinase
MRPAADATLIDTTGLNIEQVVDRLASDIDRHLVKR